MKTRHMVLALALVATVAASVIPSAPQQEVVQARAPVVQLSPNRSGGMGSAGEAQSSMVRRLQSRSSGDETTDTLFAVRSWTPAAPPSAPPQPVVTSPAATPPPPQAPPPPFRLVGRYETEDGIIVFLEHQQQLLPAKLGDVLLNAWKVEKIDAQRMALLYVPLNQTKTLEWAANP